MSSFVFEYSLELFDDLCLGVQLIQFGPYNFFVVSDAFYDDYFVYIVDLLYNYSIYLRTCL